MSSIVQLFPGLPYFSECSNLFPGLPYFSVGLFTPIIDMCCIATRGSGCNHWRFFLPIDQFPITFQWSLPQLLKLLYPNEITSPMFHHVVCWLNDVKLPYVYCWSSSPSITRKKISPSDISIAQRFHNHIQLVHIMRILTIGLVTSCTVMALNRAWNGLTNSCG